MRRAEAAGSPSDPRRPAAATLAWLAAALVLLCVQWTRIAGLEVSGPPASPPDGLWWPDPPRLTPFTLTDQDGRELTERELTGTWTLIFFGYTHCPDVCPTTLATLMRARQALAPALRQPLAVLFVSVDAGRDGPEVLAPYVRHFGAGIRGATAPMEALHLLTRQLGAEFARIGGDQAGVYWYDHATSIFLVAPDLRVVAELAPPFDANALAKRVQAICRFVEAER